MIKIFLSFLLCLLLLVGCRFSPNNNQSSKINDTLTVSGVDDLQTPQDHYIMGKEFAKHQLDELFIGKGQPFTWDTLIKSPSIAVAIAEPILFDLFGKSQILQEKPYEVYLINGYWYISGTIPKGSKGGGFEIIFSAKDGKIIRVTHYK